ncbi:ATP-dependent Clp protease ATP-binding subunit [Weissella minor]|uniref:AAA family ATPase n=1 Tax=Weissella minor TaxID=1620 RepID=UPI001BAE90B9|nr:AAA family ATPase [Weissella minor]MBS0949227.1 ATP-dependent Clp protease ATP-binding subunit [Weissella minor]
MERSVIDRFTVNMSRKVAADPDRYRTYKREAETKQLREILNQDRKNSAALTGEAGVGKTAIVENLAVEMLDDQVQDAITGKEILMLTLPNLMEFSSGQSFASNLQHLVDELVEQNDQYLLFIDEMHQLMGTGSTNGSMMDAANILKPVIGRGEINVIGATTDREYAQSIELDNAMDRRFDKVPIEETNYEQTLFIMRKVADSYARLKHVETHTEQLDYIYQLADRFMTTQAFPEKAIMLLDSATTIAYLEGSEVLEKRHAAQKIHNGWHVPMKVLLEEDSERILKLPEVLHSRVIGQDDALATIERKVRARAAGLSDPSKPMSFFLAGPTGVGKTETAKALGEALFGSENDMIRFDMSEFKFAERSMTTFLERVSKAVKFHPYSVLLLDEVEKADPLVLDLLLQILDDGRLTNAAGNTINFKDLLIILTSNIGHEEIKSFHANSEAYKAQKRNQQTFMRNFESILMGFGMRKEFIKRLSSIIIYKPLDEASVLKIIDMKLMGLRKRAAKKGYWLEYTPEELVKRIPTFNEGYEMHTGKDALGQSVMLREPVHLLREFIMDKGYQLDDGARPIDDAINEYVENVVAEAILEERFTGKSAGHTFVIRIWGTGPDDYHTFGNWHTAISQIEVPHLEVQDEK